MVLKHKTVENALISFPLQLHVKRKGKRVGGENSLTTLAKCPRSQKGLTQRTKSYSPGKAHVSDSALGKAPSVVHLLMIAWTSIMECETHF